MNKTTGILRKSNYQQNVEPCPELLVFGYQSKLFRDDVKALEFDRESHLIPATYEPKDLISRLILSFLTQLLYLDLLCVMLIISYEFLATSDEHYTSSFELMN